MRVCVCLRECDVCLRVCSTYVFATPVFYTILSKSLSMRSSQIHLQIHNPYIHPSIKSQTANYTYITNKENFEMLLLENNIIFLSKNKHYFGNAATGKQYYLSNFSSESKNKHYLKSHSSR